MFYMSDENAPLPKATESEEKKRVVTKERKVEEVTAPLGSREKSREGQIIEILSLPVQDEKSRQ